MAIEQTLKDLILKRYNSIREFTQVADIPYTTLDSILKRGVSNASIGNILKICKALSLSVDALANGEIVYKFEESQAAPVMDVKDVVNDVKYKLHSADHIVIDGKEIDIEIVEPIFNALDIGYEMTKKNSAKKAITKTITES